MTTSTNHKYTPEEVKQILKDYRWMLNTVKAMRESLKEADGAAIAQYGIEATMPKGKGCTGDVVFGEVVRRSRQWERIEAYEERIRFIQKNLYKVREPRQAEVLYWLLEGKSNKAISKHMGLSYSHTRRIIDEIPHSLLAKGED